MKGSYSKDLPEDYKKYIHSDFVANEKHYWRKRKELLRKYRGRWVAIHDESVVADSDDIWEITEAVGKLFEQTRFRCLPLNKSIGYGALMLTLPPLVAWMIAAFADIGFPAAGD